MKAMLSVVVTVAFLATIASCANVQEYSDDVMESYSITHAIAVQYPSRLVIQPNIMIPFGEGKHSGHYDLFLRPKVVPEFTDGELCKNYFGIEVSTGRTYCNITLFGLWTGNYEGKDKRVKFFLELESDFTPPLRVEIPVYKLPAEISTRTPQEIKAWAARKQVGLVDPLEIAHTEIINIPFNVQVKLTFGWLGDLLKLKLYKNHEKNFERDGKIFDAYVSRPIVLPDDTIQRIFDVSRDIVNMLNW